MKLLALIFLIIFLLFFLFGKITVEGTQRITIWERAGGMRISSRYNDSNRWFADFRHRILIKIGDYHGKGKKVFSSG